MSDHWCEPVVRELCRDAGLCKYTNPDKCNTSRCAVTETPEWPAVSDLMFKVYVFGWRAAREQFSNLARESYWRWEPMHPDDIARRIEETQEPSQEDER